MSQSPKEAGPGLDKQSTEAPNDFSDADFTPVSDVATEYPRVRFTVGRATDGTPQTKRHNLGSDGKVATVQPVFATRGTVTVVECGLDQVVGHFEDPASFLILGVPVGAEVGKTYIHTIKGGGRGIARTKESYTWPEVALMLLDLDLKEAGMVPSMQPLMEQESQFMIATTLATIDKELKSVGSTLIGASRIARRSASSNIMDGEGNLVKDSKGVHIFLAVKGKNPGEVLDFLHKRLVIAGQGYCYVTSNGRKEIRTVIDKQVGQPNRVSFEAPAVLGEGLTRKQGKTLNTPGAVLDLTDVDLVVDEAAYDAECRRLKGLPKVAELVRKQRAEFLQAKLIEGKARGLSEEAIRASVARLCKEGDRTDLYPKDGVVFRFDDGREATIADILEDPAAYHDCSMMDPTDLKERPGKAKFYWNQKTDSLGQEQFIINLIRSGQTVFLHGEDVEERDPVEVPLSADAEMIDAVRRLAGLGELDYERVRVEEAKGLGVRTTALDSAVKEERAKAERERRQQERKAAEESGDSPTVWIEEFNASYSPVLYGGKMVVGYSEFNKALGRENMAFLSFKTFREMHIADYGVLGYDEDGIAIRGSKGKWLELEKRTPNRTLIFDPAEPPNLEREGYLNMWGGFAIKGSSVGGDPEPMLRHIREVICCDDEERIQYVMGWLALLIQQPGYQHGVALVLRGKKGTGKGTLGETLRRILGRHALHLTQSRHVTGNFNAHLQDVCFVFADEAFFAGDRSNDGPLKGLITEPTIQLEPKGVDTFTVRNWMTVLMATNSEWVAPMGADERRYAVMDVSDSRLGDRDYFNAMVAWGQDNANVTAFIEYMQAYDLSDFNVRAVPETEGLQQQRAHSLPMWAQWYGDCLSRGSLIGGYGAVWLEEVANELAYQSFCSYLDFRKTSQYDRLAANAFGKKITPLLGQKTPLPFKPGKTKVGVDGPWTASTFSSATTDAKQETISGRRHGPLSEARARFIEHFKLPADFFD